MTFSLLPGTGLVLPKNAGTLRFGMTEHAAQWTASTLAEVRDGGWMCKTHWNFLVAHQGITVTAYSCTYCASCTGQTLGHLLVERFERVPEGPADEPVAFGDLDLFGYPIHELVEVLQPVDRELLLPANTNPRSTHYLPAVRLDACEALPCVNESMSA